MTTYVTGNWYRKKKKNLSLEVLYHFKRIRRKCIRIPIRLDYSNRIGLFCFDQIDYSEWVMAGHWIKNLKWAISSCVVLDSRDYSQIPLRDSSEMARDFSIVVYLVVKWPRWVCEACYVTLLFLTWPFL